MRCVVLTGTGKAFCTGQDLKEHIELLQNGGSDALFTTVDKHYNPIVTALAAMAKPVIAAVNGVAAGAGASLAFACDLRIVADTAGFNLAFANVALSCDTGASYTLQRLVGRAKALELLYFPSTISAADALELGLATKVVPADRLGRRGGRARRPARRRPDGRARRDPPVGRVRRRALLRGVPDLRERDDDQRPAPPPTTRPRSRRSWRRRSRSSRGASAPWFITVGSRACTSPGGHTRGSAGSATDRDEPEAAHHRPRDAQRRNASQIASTCRGAVLVISRAGAGRRTRR